MFVPKCLQTSCQRSNVNVWVVVVVVSLDSWRFTWEIDASKSSGFSPCGLTTFAPAENIWKRSPRKKWRTCRKRSDIVASCAFGVPLTAQPLFCFCLQEQVSARSGGQVSGLWILTFTFKQQFVSPQYTPWFSGLMVSSDPEIVKIYNISLGGAFSCSVQIVCNRIHFLNSLFAGTAEQQQVERFAGSAVGGGVHRKHARNYGIWGGSVFPLG